MCLLCQRTVLVVSRCTPTAGREREGQVPKIIFIDGANSPHFGDFSSNTNELQTNVGPRLDGQPLVVSELRGSCVGVVDTCLGDGLEEDMSASAATILTADLSSSLSTYVSRCEYCEGARFGKKPVSINRVGDHSIDLENH